MADTRHKNENWNLGESNANNCVSWQQMHMALLMDIRDELQKLNALLHCGNFLAIPERLQRMADKADPPTPRGPRCGAPTQAGSRCVKPVNFRGDRCHHHPKRRRA